MKVHFLANEVDMCGMKRILTIGWMLSLAVVTGCDRGGPDDDSGGFIAPGVTSVALADAGDGTGKTLFERLDGKAVGMPFRNDVDNEHRWMHLYTSAFAGGGVCIGDYDDDGRPDVFLTSQTGRNRLYRQVSDWQFKDVSDAAGIDSEVAWSSGATFVDIDNDGDLDLYVCNYEAANKLYINDGEGKFEDQAREMGLDYTGASHTMAFADYDRDGDLDAYLLTNRMYPLPGEEPKYEIKNVGGKPVIAERHRRLIYALELPGGGYRFEAAGDRDFLYRNNGDGTFTDVTKDAGLEHDTYYHGLSATWWDYDNDGDEDLYVANDFWAPDFLYRNNGDGTFTDVIRQAVPHTPWFSMGSDAADINNDGHFDFLATDMAATTHFMEKTTMGAMGANTWFMETAEPRQYMRNAMFLNTGTDRFMEIAFMSGLAKSDWTWCPKFGDLDNDGRLDLFITNGIARSLMNSDQDLAIERMRKEALAGRPAGSLTRDEQLQLQVKQWEMVNTSPARPETNLAFRNTGDLRFEKSAKAWGLDHKGISWGAAYGDLDRDGDLDLIVSNVNEGVGIYRNNGTSGNRVVLQLVGDASNRFGVGAVVRAIADGMTQTRRLTLARGYMSCNEPMVHLGLGDAKQIDELIIDWPSGKRQTLKGMPAGRLYTITEPANAPKRPVEEQAPPMFELFKGLEAVAHKERRFNDYARQTLLPWHHSQLGPGIAVGDIDGDGDDDVVLAGAAGQGAQIHVNQGDGSFRWRVSSALQDHAHQEDLCPLLFDADGDGDLDLYMSSGGTEVELGGPSEASLRDRLYLNDGKGRFTIATRDALPDVLDSSSVVTAADFDHDGDLDLFVGGRVIPGKYPLSPSSRLLRNDGGKFVDVTDDAAPGLRQAGLVTSAVWSDATGDGRVDLLLSIEWGPIKLFVNDGGRLRDATKDAGLADRTGWWNGIAAADLDRDGDMDYIVTNFGVNTKYHASPKHPSLLYYGDFEGDGKFCLVEAKDESDIIYPVRGRSCSSTAMPFIADKFPTYKSFGLASLDSIYTKPKLEQAHRFAATELRSGVLINESDSASTPRFRFVALPLLAQAAPSFGIVAQDFDADGNIDVYLAQNFFSTQIETGRMDGGVGLLLRGDGKGGLSPVWPSRSGLIVTGDAKGAASLDLNADGLPDLLTTRNDETLVAHRNRAVSSNRILTVKLKGRPGNPTGVGARVTLIFDNGSRQTREVAAGGGYLSQSSAAAVFGLGQSKAKQIEVRWPGVAESTRQNIAAGDRNVDVAHP